MPAPSPEGSSGGSRRSFSRAHFHGMSGPCPAFALRADRRRENQNARCGFLRAGAISTGELRKPYLARIVKRPGNAVRNAVSSFAVSSNVAGSSLATGAANLSSHKPANACNDLLNTVRRLLFRRRRCLCLLHLKTLPNALRPTLRLPRAASSDCNATNDMRSTHTS